MKKITVNDPEFSSMDLTAENLAQLKALFPEAFTEGKIDFEVLKQLLGGAVEEREEKYGLNWHGKRRARQLALTPSLGTLRPSPEESVDWDTTQNLMIEGDNLEVLKLLQKSYSGKVKLIYIDPPYNTGKDFVYPDDFRDNIKNYLQVTGQVDGNGHKVSTNTESSGRFHTDWLNMMYPRLVLAKNLLSQSGVLLMSIDENEVSNVQLVLNEIFGEENSIATFIWKRKAGGGDDSGHVAIEHEYVLCYGRNRERTTLGRIQHESPSMTAKYNRSENGRRYYLERLDKASLTYSRALDYEIECPDGTRIKPPHPDPLNPSTIWRWSRDKVAECRDELTFQKDKTGEWRVYTKTWESLDGVTPRSLLVDKEHGRNRDGTQDLAGLLGAKVFSNPKPLRLMRHLLQVAASEKDAVILDFFGGSGTMGQAVMEFNNTDNGMRRFIIVQLPEPCDNNGFATISDITKKRLSLAGVNIRDTSPLYAGDIGFRVFKLDSSNLRAWDSHPIDFEQAMIDHIEHLVPGRTEEDLLFEILLKRGVDLCSPIDAREIAGKTVYTVGGVLFACLGQEITLDVTETLALGIVEWRKELDPSTDSTVVFRDSAFVNDVAKANITEILKQHGFVKVESL